MFDHLLKTRGEKYRWFLRALRLFKYLSMNLVKGEFLESYYTLMRYVDDVVDGDAALPERFGNSIDFVLEKIEFVKNPRSPKDRIDCLAAYCFELAKGMGEDFSQESQDILNSMLFDARRYGKKLVFPEAELMHHFHLLDVRGTIGAAVKIFGEDPKNGPLLAPLGLASRIYYNLRDYKEDILAGFVNISSEDCDKFGINPLKIEENLEGSLEYRISLPVQGWMKAQAEKGLSLIRDYQDNLSASHFRFVTRLALPAVYEKPARKFFEKVLKSN